MKKAKLSSKQVKHIAQLAGLRLNPKEIKKFQRQLSEILKYVEILQKVDTRKVEPTSQVTGLENVFREDKKEESLNQKEVLANAPASKRGFIITKLISEKWS